MNRYEVHGDVGLIYLNRGYIAIVDSNGLSEIIGNTWTVLEKRERVYAVRKREPRYMHSVVMGTTEMIDHKNGYGLDNRKCNLEITSPQANSTNQEIHRDNPNWYFGVDVVKGRYRARHSGQYLGLFDTAEDAAKAYDEYVYEKYGERARLNFKRNP